MKRNAKEYAGASGLPRLPAQELEETVISQLRTLMKAPEMIDRVLPKAKALDPALGIDIVRLAMNKLDVVWDELFPQEQARIVNLLVERVA